MTYFVFVFSLHTQLSLSTHQTDYQLAHPQYFYLARSDYEIGTSSGSQSNYQLTAEKLFKQVLNFLNVRLEGGAEQSFFNSIAIFYAETRVERERAYHLFIHSC